MSGFLVSVALFVLATVALGLLRVLAGPSAADRVMAIQLLGTVAGIALERGHGRLASVQELAWVALANTVVVLSAYLAIAALIWGLADARCPRRAITTFFRADTRRAYVARRALSDVHVVGERYGFRIESGRSGPQGDGRFRRLLRLLEDIHASAPLDAVIISGDATDAGRSGEWAEFLDALAAHPEIAGRVLMLPGNHDVNIVDRANPARLDLSIGPNSRLRKIRTLSAIDAVQGSRVRVVDQEEKRSAKRSPKRCNHTPPSWRDLPQPVGPTSQPQHLTGGTTRFPWWCHRSARTAWASSCSTPTRTPTSPSPTRSG